MSLKWVDVLEIAIQLAESKPEVDPRYVNFVDLHRWVLALPEFSDDPSRGGEKVLEAIVTHETAFFRDKHPYETLRHTILTRLAQRWQATRETLGHRPTPIRIWCAACSTGQEPWSVAMAIHEWIPLSGVSGLSLGDFAILATDLSSKVLDHARQGIYTEADLARGMTPGQISRFLNRQPGAKPTFQMKAELRSMVEFRKANLREGFKSLGLFDLILCRNMLMYLGEASRCKVLDNLANVEDLSWIGPCRQFPCKSCQGLRCSFASACSKTSSLL